MLKINRHCGVRTKICLILVYVSFYLVQLDVHFGPTPGPSFFSSDYASEHSDKVSNTFLNKNIHKGSKPASFRLNKRFHPEYLFTVPEVLQDLVKYSFRIQTSLLNETQPLTNFSFNSPSLRGPPQVV